MLSGLAGIVPGMGQPQAAPAAAVTAIKEAIAEGEGDPTPNKR